VGKLIKTVLVVVVAVGIGVAVSMLIEQRQRFLAMTEEEQRSFIADKLGDKVSEGKLAEIQDKVVAAAAQKKL
jgi:uncharacterized protein YneF (UPF0154 family)